MVSTSSCSTIDGLQELPSWWCQPENAPPDEAKYGRFDDRSAAYLIFMDKYPDVTPGSCMEQLCLDPALRYARMQLKHDKSSFGRHSIGGSDAGFSFGMSASAQGSAANPCLQPVSTAAVSTFFAYVVFSFCVLVILCSGLCSGLWRGCYRRCCTRGRRDGGSSGKFTSDILNVEERWLSTHRLLRRHASFSIQTYITCGPMTSTS